MNAKLTAMMTTRALVASLALMACTAAPVLADQHVPPRQISVTGEARTEVAPDRASITLGVTAKAESAADAMRAVSQDMAAVIDGLRAAGIAAEDMQTQRISVDPVWSGGHYDSGSGKREITGFVASNTLLVRVRDLGNLGAILDDVLDAGANEFRGLSFGVADRAAVLDQIRGDAVRDAIRKARQLAEAAGMTLGPVRSISEHGGGGGVPMMAMEMARSGGVPVEAGSLSFEHGVSVVFDLLEPKPE
ncbi:SIMPL domain-containing protein [Phycobacter sp. K97]|uniref:SIMPL domain-containing protein n=1 Tax=Phycobacter sedimenti TaxID=3133977 RepID=UPI00311D43E7